MSTYFHEHGVLTTGKHRKENGWWRDDVYTSRKTNETVIDPHRCLDETDNSDIVTTYGKQSMYDAGCSCCWLHIPHTQQLHENNIYSDKP